MRLYDRVTFGNARPVPPDRRSPVPLASALRAAGPWRLDPSSRSAPIARPARTMLGEVQERWLDAGLDRSRARAGTCIAQQTLMAQLDRKVGAGRRFWTDGWDGYPAARRRLLDYLGTQAGQPGGHRRRRARVLGRRPQARLRRPPVAGGGHRVRRHLDHLAVREVPAGDGRAARREPPPAPGQRRPSRLRADGRDAQAPDGGAARDAVGHSAAGRGGHAGHVRCRGGRLGAVRRSGDLGPQSREIR